MAGFLGRREKQIGYFKRSHAQRVAKVLDAGRKIQATIDHIYAPEGFSHPEVKLHLDY